MILFHAYSSPFPGQYILSVYIAWAGAPNLLPTAQAVLASISCQTQLRPAEPVSVKAAKPGTKRNAGKGGEGDSLKDYNAQLGTQWAHSASGQHYLLDRASQWNDNGPDGPGYYAKIGNSMEKLTTGW